MVQQEPEGYVGTESESAVEAQAQAESIEVVEGSEQV